MQAVNFDLTSVEISPTKILSIKRSYPQGKPENLVAGLNRLLSDKGPWELSSSQDAISRFVVITSRQSLDEFIETVKRASDSLGHHPHIATQSLSTQERWVSAVTCTTHVPHGLSLKDVKLAEKIDEIVERVGGMDLSGSGDDAEVAGVASDLVKENERAAVDARTNPESICVKRG